MISCSRHALNAYDVPGTVLDAEELWTRLDIQAASVINMYLGICHMISPVQGTD